MNLAKRITVAGLLVFVFLLVSLSMHQNLVGMTTSQITYTCTDNDVFSSEPINSRGTVTVASSIGERNIYTDYCVGDKIVEYSCDPETNNQTSSEESCMYEQVCYLGRCMVK